MVKAVECSIPSSLEFYCCFLYRIKKVITGDGPLPDKCYGLYNHSQCYPQIPSEIGSDTNGRLIKYLFKFIALENMFIFIFKFTWYDWSFYSWKRKKNEENSIAGLFYFFMTASRIAANCICFLTCSQAEQFDSVW